VSFADRTHTLQEYAENTEQNNGEQNNIKEPARGSVVAKDHLTPLVSPGSAIMIDKVRVSHW